MENFVIFSFIEKYCVQQDRNRCVRSIQICKIERGQTESNQSITCLLVLRF